MTIEDVALTFVRGLGAKGVAHLLEEFPTARDIYASSLGELIERTTLREEIARRIISREGFAEAEREMNRCYQRGIHIIASTDKEYPPLMRLGVTDYPHVIYVMGDVGALGGRLLSVVGTRTCSAHCEGMCNKLIAGIAERVGDVGIVSGLAFGADSYAHRAALVSGLKTIAVVPTVLPAVTPSEHTNLANDILANGGAIVSELNSATRQKGVLYIARNRMIAAMSEGTLVLESSLKGGSISTAQIADSYHRVVMALPGRPTDTKSAGTNMLIRRNLAHLVTSADDIAECMGWEITTPEDRMVEPVELSDNEARILACFGVGESLTTDEISSRAGLSAAELLSQLMMLEIKGLVRTLPADKYEKI